MSIDHVGRDEFKEHSDMCWVAVEAFDVRTSSQMCTVSMYMMLKILAVMLYMYVLLTLCDLPISHCF